MGNNLKASQTQNEDSSYTLHPVEVGINLPKGEFCYFAGKTELFEERKVTKNVSFRGPTFRMKILPGLSYRFGNINLGKKTEVELCKVDEGMIFVTNKRILFVGVSGSQKIDFKKIVDLGAEEDVLTIIRDSGSNKFFKIKSDASYTGNLIKALMKATS